jgi:hypothetical protein
MNSVQPAPAWLEWKLQAQGQNWGERGEVFPRWMVLCWGQLWIWKMRLLRHGQCEFMGSKEGQSAMHKKLEGNCSLWRRLRRLWVERVWVADIPHVITSALIILTHLIITTTPWTNITLISYMGKWSRSILLMATDLRICSQVAELCSCAS